MSYLPCIGSLEPFEPTSLEIIFGPAQMPSLFWWEPEYYEAAFRRAAIKPKTQTVWIVDDD